MSNHRLDQPAAVPLLGPPRKEVQDHWAGIRVLNNHYLAGWMTRAVMTGRTLHLGPEVWERASRLDGLSLSQFLDTLEVMLFPELCSTAYKSLVQRARAQSLGGIR